MADILEFCTSGYRALILVALVGFLALLFQVMVVTTVLRWLVRFVRDAWHSDAGPDEEDETE